MKRSVLIVEDEDLIREIVRDYFQDAGYKVTEAENGEEAVEYVKTEDFDLILLDLMLPEMDGFTVCREIRKIKTTPIIVVTARSEEEDKLMGYNLGIDDYMTKPFSPKVLLAKANALINRAEGNVLGDDNLIKAAGIVINQESHTVTVDDEYIDLTRKEYDLLMYLMRNRGKVLTRETLLTKIWGIDYLGDLRTVDTHIKKLRAKLGQKAKCIRTLVKSGYKFDENINDN